LRFAEAGRNSTKNVLFDIRVPKSASAFGKRKSEEAKMRFLACEETNAADFALTIWDAKK